MNSQPYMAARVKPEPPYLPRACYTDGGLHKVKHKGKAQARTFLTNIYGKTWRRQGFDIYRCPHCRYWHVGHAR